MKNLFNKYFGWRFKLANWLYGDDLRFYLGHIKNQLERENLSKYEKESMIHTIEDIFRR